MSDFVSPLLTLFGALSTLLTFVLDVGLVVAAAGLIRPKRPDAWMWIAGPAIAKLVWGFLHWGLSAGISAAAFRFLDYDLAAIVMSLSGFLFSLVSLAIYGALIFGITKLANPPAADTPAAS